MDSLRPSRLVMFFFVGLAAIAWGDEFDLPQVDEGRIRAAGIRRLEGKHLTLYTDLPAAKEVDELPRVFDAAAPLWCGYFGIDAAKVAEWKLIGCVMKAKGPFVAAGLYPASLPDFPHGYSMGSQIWVYEQPSDYYRRHLLLHEGTHAFMARWLGGGGPPWYMEGLAELLGTHAWSDGKLTLGVMPKLREEVPYWGRVKIVKDDMATGKRKSLQEIMQYDARAHLQVEAYGWCWAAAAFLDQHPLTQTAFRELKADTRTRSLAFSRRFYDKVKENWPAMGEDWQLFAAECDYGYDVRRAATVRKATIELPAEGATVSIAADRGWQSTGFKLASGRKYRLTASGRYFVRSEPKPWPCEAGGVTIRYHAGRPLGMLLAAVGDTGEEIGAVTPLARPQGIGVEGEVESKTGGTLYLKINEAAGGLGDNSGSVTVTIRVGE